MKTKFHNNKSVKKTTDSTKTKKALYEMLIKDISKVVKAKLDENLNEQIVTKYEEESDNVMLEEIKNALNEYNELLFLDIDENEEIPEDQEDEIDDLERVDIMNMDTKRFQTVFVVGLRKNCFKNRYGNFCDYELIYVDDRSVAVQYTSLDNVRQSNLKTILDLIAEA